MSDSKNDSVRIFTSLDFKLGNTVNKAHFLVFENVFDLTNLIEENRASKQADNMIAWIGKDVSHFFDPVSKLPIRKHEFLVKNMTQRQKEESQFLHFDHERCTAEGVVPWYLDQRLIIGKITKREIKLRIVNTLSYTEDVLVVPIEETLDQICERYLHYNSHARSYLWKDIEGRVLDMETTLEGNELQ